jgi:hypothetical protein
VILNPRQVGPSLGMTGLAVYVVGAVLAPIVHLVRDHEPVRPEVRAQSIDPAQFKDPRTQKVDLARLAAALGLNGQVPHESSKPHSHGPGDGTPGDGPLSHGTNAIEHFGLAMLAAALSLVIVVAPSPELPPPPSDRAPAPTLLLRHLAAQRAQAPPLA